MSISSSIEVEAWRYKFNELPPEVAKRFSDAERDAYCEGSNAIIRALKMTGEVSATKACNFFDEGQPFRVYIEDFLSSPIVWFGLSDIKLKHEVRVRLPELSGTLQWAPTRIKSIFQSIGGIISGNPYSPRLLRPLQATDLGWVVLVYANGARLTVSETGDSHYFDHETGRRIPVSLDFYLDEFLTELFAIDELFLD